MPPHVTLQITCEGPSSWKVLQTRRSGAESVSPSFKDGVSEDRTLPGPSIPVPISPTRPAPRDRVKVKKEDESPDFADELDVRSGWQAAAGPAAFRISDSPFRIPDSFSRERPLVEQRGTPAGPARLQGGGGSAEHLPQPSRLPAERPAVEASLSTFRMAIRGQRVRRLGVVRTRGEAIVRELGPQRAGTDGDHVTGVGTQSGRSGRASCRK
jgi:hypothetical protein